MGQGIMANQKTFVLLKEGQIYYYEKVFIIAKLISPLMYLHEFPIRKNFAR